MTSTTETARARRSVARINSVLPPATEEAASAFAAKLAATPGGEAEIARADRIRARIAAVVKA